MGTDIEVASSLEAGGQKAFFATALPGRAMRVSLWAQSGRASDSLVLAVYADSGGPLIGTLSSVGTQAALNDRVLHYPAQPEPLRLYMTVRGAAADDSGPFRISVRAPDMFPERAPTQLVIGDSVFIEHMDSNVDLDRFMFMGEAGAQYMVSFGFRTPNPPLVAWIDFETEDQQPVLGTYFYWNHQELIEKNSVRVQTTRSEPYFLKVRASIPIGSPPAPAFGGRYTLWMYKINPRPESARETIVVNDTVFDAIDVHGDVDIYSFAADSGDILRLDAWILRSQSPDISIDIVEPQAAIPGRPQHDALYLRNAITRLDGAGRRFGIRSTGVHRIVVRGGFVGRMDSVTTPYRLELRRINTAPETTFPQRAVRDSVVGETMPRSGDIDEFRVPLRRGEMVAVRGAVTVADTAARFDFSASRGGRDETGGSFGHGVPVMAAVEAVDDSTTAIVRIRGWEHSIGTYRLDFYPIDQAPESVSPILPINTLVSEPIAPAQDVDDFRFALVPGRRYNILAMKDGRALTDQAVVAKLPQTVPVLAEQGASGSFIAESSDTLSLRVFGDTTDAYQLMVYEIDTLPESRPSTIAVGDTVRSESILLPGDIDTFTFTATAGTRLRVRIDRVGGWPGFEPLLQVFDGAEGATSVSAQSGVPTEFTAPSTGVYRIRVRANNDTYLTIGAGNYTFSLVAVP